MTKTKLKKKKIKAKTFIASHCVEKHTGQNYHYIQPLSKLYLKSLPRS